MLTLDILSYRFAEHGRGVGPEHLQRQVDEAGCKLPNDTTSWE